jgi:hypothetical protein
MGLALTALLMFIVLGAPFGEANVEGAPSADGLQVEFEVFVEGAPVAVVAHLADPGQTQQTVSLANRSGGVWGGVAGLDVMNYVVVFEAVDTGGEGTLSNPTTLLELGMDSGLLGMDGVVPGAEADKDSPLSPVTRRWGWGAAALTAIALALLALWAMGEKVRGKHAAPRGKRRKRPQEPHRPV